MATRRLVWSLVLAYFGLMTGARAYGEVSFSPDPMDLSVPQGSALNEQLGKHLSGHIPGEKWDVQIYKLNASDPALPSWLSIKNGGTPNPILVAAATAPVGTIHFKLGIAGPPPDDQGVFAVVNLTISSPAQCTLSNIDLGKTPEETPFTTLDLSKVCSDPSGHPLQPFKISDPSHMPGFVALTPQGVLTAWPRWDVNHLTVGDFGGFDVVVTTSTGGTLNLPVKGTVLRWFRPPVWSAHPIHLPDGTDDTTYSQELSSYVHFFESTTSAPPTYTMPVGPADGWATVDAVKGTLSGTPTPLVDDGPVNWTVKVAQTDPTPGGTTVSDQTNVQFSINHVFQTPVCKNPIDLPDTLVVPVPATDLSPNCSDPGHDTLHYSFAQGGPAWGKVTDAGVFSGTPTVNNVGPNQWTMNVSNGHKSTNTVVRIKVLKTPAQWTKNPIQLPLGQVGTSVLADLNPYLINPDGGPLTCKLSGSSSWFGVSAGCRVSGTPGASDLGDQSFQVTVNDGSSPDAATTVNITIAPAQITLTPNPKEREVYSNSLAPFAPSAQAYQFSKTSGPNWMTFQGSGDVGGTPARDDVNQSPETFMVKAVHPTGQVNIKVFVTVDKVPQPPTCAQTAFTYNAQVGIQFTASLGSNVTDPNHESYVFSITGPSWLKTSTGGDLSGIPLIADESASPESATVTATNTDNMFCTMQLTLNVSFVPLSWTQSPINLGDIMAGNTVNASLKPYIKNPSGVPFTCSKTSVTPGWFIVNSDCTVTGTPGKTDVTAPNQYNVGVAVSDPDPKDPAVPNTVVGRVIKAITPPQPQNPNMIFTIYERDDFKVDLTQPQYIINENDGDTLSCTATTPSASWVSLSSTCQLELTPKHGNITGPPPANPAKFDFTVSNTHSQSAPATITVYVLRKAQPVQCPQAVTWNAMAGVSFAQTLKDQCKDLDNVPLTFAPIGALPSWLKNDAAGNFNGTPAQSDVATINFVEAVKNDVLEADVNVTIIVASGLPVCKDPMVLPGATVSLPYQQNIAGFCTNPIPGSLQFSRVDTTTFPWATVTSGGGLIGTPTKADIGNDHFLVKVCNTNGCVVPPPTVSIEVTAPQIAWIQDPINVGKWPVGKPHTFSLVPFVRNPSGAQLQFSWTSAPHPSWLFLSSAGVLSGNAPLPTGPFTGAVQVTAGGDFLSAGIFGEVIKGANVSGWEYTVFVDDTLDKDLNPGVSGNGPFNFGPPNPDTWITLTYTGRLTAKPKKTELGDHSYTITVTDANAIDATGQLIIHVKDKPCLAPVWSQDPIQMTGKVGKAMTGTLAGYVSDPQHTKLTFNKMWYPDNDFLIVATNGGLSGTPGATQVGLNRYDIEAANECGKSSDATLFIDVKSEPVIDTVNVDDSVPWAHPIAENLWVVDSACSCGHHSEFATLFANNLDSYFNQLSGVEFAGIYISSNPEPGGLHKSAITGRPIPGRDGSILITSSEASPAADLKQRIDRTDNCPNNNSPIWAMFLFYPILQGPAMASIYPSQYFQPRVPMDTLMVTNHPDHFRYWDAKTPQASWTPQNFASNFIQYHSAAGKPFRMSAMTDKCVWPDGRAHDETPGDCTGGTMAQDPAYDALVTSTAPDSGHHWIEDGALAISADLAAYGQMVRFRAMLLSKNAVPLSKTPSDPTQIKVFVGGKQLNPNQWKYDANKNQVLIFWEKIDISGLKPGDRIEIQYAA